MKPKQTYEAIKFRQDRYHSGRIGIKKCQLKKKKIIIIIGRMKNEERREKERKKNA